MGQKRLLSVYLGTGLDLHKAFCIPIGIVKSLISPTKGYSSLFYLNNLQELLQIVLQNQ